MRILKKFFAIIFFIILLFGPGCKNETGEEQKNKNPNPPAEGFDVENSDPKAIQIADSVMEAMGGREAWDNTRYIQWTFFERRKLLWDKETGNVRIETMAGPEDSKDVYLVNIHSLDGKVLIDGEELTNPDSLSKYLNRAKSIWINDSYWLVMPFKLKDTGVTLKYLREDTTMDGEMADVLELTFNHVGDTPDNKYEIWVDQDKDLITQWAYFRKADQDSANFIRQWDNYRKYGEIMLSGDRSEGGPGEIKVYKNVPEEAFTSFESPGFEE